MKNMTDGTIAPDVDLDEGCKILGELLVYSYRNDLNKKQRQKFDKRLSISKDRSPSELVRLIGFMKKLKDIETPKSKMPKGKK